MEYANNGCLKNFINNSPYLEWSTNLRMMKEMTEGLHYIHSQGIIHRDLKSLNVLLGRKNITKICDFGLSKVADNISSLKTRTKHSFFGTPRWMAPEVTLKKNPHSKYSDIYSLGMIFWELCSKCTVPFKGVDEAFIMVGYFRGKREEIPTNTPSGIKSVIKNCWLEDHKQRISTGQIINKLENIILSNYEINEKIIYRELDSSDNNELLEIKNYVKSLIEQKILDPYELEVLISEEKVKEKPILRESLGQGGFASVYRATWKGQEVAVKKSLYNLSPVFQKEIDAIKKEINLLKELRNKYIIQYYDFYQEDQEFMIITELAEKGTLTNYINQHKDRDYDWNINYNFIKHMTLGISYLHHSSIVHRDLKSMNIMITEGMIAKIGDFGLSKVMDNLGGNLSSSKGTSGTMAWMDPYLFKAPSNKHCFATDIYALGMVIWEIVAKKFPYSHLDGHFVIAYLLTGHQEEIPTDTPLVLKEIIKGCWENDFSKRISLEQITKQIEAVLKAEETTITSEETDLNLYNSVVGYETEVDLFIEQPSK